MQASRFEALVGPAYKYQSLPVDCQECVNFECIKVGSSASPFKNMLVGTAGTKRVRFKYNGEILDVLPTYKAKKSRIRGMHKCSLPFGNDVDDGFIIVGTDCVYKMEKPNKDLVAKISLIGNISEGTSIVSIIDSGVVADEKTPQVISIADGNTLYNVNMSTMEFTSVGNEIPLRPNMISFMNGRAIICGKSHEDGKQSMHVFFSELNNANSWPFLNDISANVESDPVVGIKVVGNYLWLIGTETYEIWQKTENVDMPFRMVSGIASGVGAASASSIASIAASVFFVGGGETGRLRIYEGSSNGSIQVISTDAMAQELSTYTTLDDAIGFCWADEGNVYYGVTFPSADTTWVYNATSKNWHKRTSTKDSISHRWNVDFLETSYNMVLGSSIENGVLYHVSTKYLDDDGEAIVRKRTAPHLVSNAKEVVHNSLTIELECGNAQPYGQGSDPKVMLKVLDDGGRTERATRWKSVGALGNYRSRVKFYNLGSTRDRVYEIGVSDPVVWNIYGAYIETEEAIGG